MISQALFEHEQATYPAVSILKWMNTFKINVEAQIIIFSDLVILDPMIL